MPGDRCPATTTHDGRELQCEEDAGHEGRHFRAVHAEPGLDHWFTWVAAPSTPPEGRRDGE